MYIAGIFNRSSVLANTLGRFYSMLKERGTVISDYMPIIILMVLGQLFFVCFMVPGLTVFQLIASHFIANMWFGFILLALPMIFMLFILSYIVKKEIKDWALKKFENDHMYRLLERNSEKYSKLTSIISWSFFMPLGKKIYIMTVLRITDKISAWEFYLPAVIFMPLHAAI